MVEFTFVENYLEPFRPLVSGSTGIVLGATRRSLEITGWSVLGLRPAKRIRALDSVWYTETVGAGRMDSEDAMRVHPHPEIATRLTDYVSVDKTR